MKEIAIIAAVAENRVIGKSGDLPWHLPKDLKFFKQKTSGHVLIMGRKTYTSFGRPLPNRLHLVVSSSLNVSHPAVKVFADLASALQFAQENAGERTIFISGGQQVYQSALPLVNTLYLTEVKATVDGDTYFPEIDLSEWDLVAEEECHADEKHAFDFTFKTYKRKKA